MALAAELAFIAAWEVRTRRTGSLDQNVMRQLTLAALKDFGDAAKRSVR